MAQNNQNNSGSNRGFAAMDPEKQREIASQGGKAAHESGNAHEFDSREAKIAGQKGGKASHQNSNSNDSSNNESSNRDMNGGNNAGNNGEER